MKTPNVQHIVDDLLARFPGLTVGAWNCRRISGTLTWSQHAYTEGTKFQGNAADVFGPVFLLDQAHAYLQATYPYPFVIAHLLWRVKDHGPQYPPVHLHFDTWPQGTGTPPCRSGSLRVKHRDGKLGTHFTDDLASVPTPPPVPIPSGDDTMEFIIKILKGQTVAFYQAVQAKTGVPGGDAAYWGSNYVPPPGQNKPTEQEWRDAADDLFGAALQAGVFQP